MSWRHSMRTTRIVPQSNPRSVVFVWGEIWEMCCDCRIIGPLESIMIRPANWNLQEENVSIAEHSPSFFSNLPWKQIGQFHSKTRIFNIVTDMLYCIIILHKCTLFTVSLFRYSIEVSCQSCTFIIIIVWNVYKSLLSFGNTHQFFYHYDLSSKYVYVSWSYFILFSFYQILYFAVTVHGTTYYNFHAPHTSIDKPLLY